MNTQDVIDFFDRLAPSWDADMIPRDRVISHILDNAEISEGMDVLDVACGTGVLFPHYMNRNVRSVTGIDISPEMVRMARDKYAVEDRVELICGDVETAHFHRQFDAVVVYNAFPHFPSPTRLIESLSGLVKDGGVLTIAHGMSREQINDHHKGSASKVSCGLISIDDLRVLFAPRFDVSVSVSNREMYQLCGVKKPQDASAVHHHSHAGAQVHSHAHGHAHAHTHAPSASLEETRALLEYMLSHNEHHAEELAELMDTLPQEAAKRMSYAIGSFEAANVDLRSVLDCL